MLMVFNSDFKNPGVREDGLGDNTQPGYGIISVISSWIKSFVLSALQRVHGRSHHSLAAAKPSGELSTAK